MCLFSNIATNNHRNRMRPFDVPARIREGGFLLIGEGEGNAKFKFAPLWCSLGRFRFRRWWRVCGRYGRQGAAHADPAYNWTGFYVGVNGGYGWRDESAATFNPNDPIANSLLSGGVASLPTASTRVISPAYRLSGGLGGAQAGYNWQFANWVAGIEADIEGANINGSGSTSFFAPVGGVTTTGTPTSSTRMDWFGTVRGRVGYLATDKLLIFGTGGLAYGQVRDSVNIGVSGLTGLGNATFSFNCGFAGPAGNSPQANCFAGTTSRTTVGWTAGGGVEYAVWKNVSVKFDYLYVDLGNSSVNVVASNVFPAFFGGQTPTSFTARFADHYNIVRAGVNWKL